GYARADRRKEIELQVLRRIELESSFRERLQPRIGRLPAESLEQLFRYIAPRREELRNVEPSTRGVGGAVERPCAGVMRCPVRFELAIRHRSAQDVEYLLVPRQ